MTEILQTLTGNLVDTLIYAATGIVFLVGMFKCVFPVRRAAGRLRRAIHMLETMPSSETGRPVWQDSLFLGKQMQTAWRRFLSNAEQLDARGLSCNLEDYVNDDTVIYSVGHVQLSEVIPGLLTSLGILGTFIGLMRGLGGLDVSDAAKTMESIPAMIGGMTFAFATSIVGISCSLTFNIFNRMASGSATAAIDDFQNAFSDLVMQRPLDDNVQLICQQEDREALLRHTSTDLVSRVSDGVTQAVEKSLLPVTQSMNKFIMGQTQSQMEGIAAISQQFVTQMNRALGGQLLKLGETLSALNQSQTVSYDALERAMASADTVMQNMTHIQSVTEQLMTRFEGYISSVETSQRNNDAFLTHGSQVLSGMMTASDEQDALLARLKTQQGELDAHMREYADWSGRVLTAVKTQSDGAAKWTQDAGEQMRKSAELLSGSYSSFVENIGSGLSKSVGLFDENIGSILNVLNEKLASLRKAASATQETDAGLVTEITKLQRAMTDMRQSLDALGEAFKASGREEAL